ncbi:hypothetical protein EDD15DRAFT_2368590 [Pisolithus albus]|nr:hypothetical protein EDD15DRAFT_2368590 [Pisolithus albus]
MYLQLQTQLKALHPQQVPPSSPWPTTTPTTDPMVLLRVELQPLCNSHPPSTPSLQSEAEEETEEEVTNPPLPPFKLFTCKPCSGLLVKVTKPQLNEPMLLPFKSMSTIPPLESIVMEIPFTQTIVPYFYQSSKLVSYFIQLVPTSRALTTAGWW